MTFNPSPLSLSHSRNLSVQSSALAQTPSPTPSADVVYGWSLCPKGGKEGRECETTRVTLLRTHSTGDPNAFSSISWLRWKEEGQVNGARFYSSLPELGGLISSFWRNSLGSLTSAFRLPVTGFKRACLRKRFKPGNRHPAPLFPFRGFGDLYHCIHLFRRVAARRGS